MASASLISARTKLTATLAFLEADLTTRQAALAVLEVPDATITSTKRNIAMRVGAIRSTRLALQRANLLT